MARNIDAPRPEKAVLKLKSVHGKKPLADLKKSIPARIVDRHLANAQLNDCCTTEENLSIEAFYVEGQEQAGVTKLEITCESCGRKHITIAGTKPAQ